MLAPGSPLNGSLPAGTRPFPTTADPIVATTLSQINALTSRGQGNLRDRIDTNSDYNRNNFNFQTRGKNNRDFPTAHIDWNVSTRHHFDFVYNYQKNLRLPDGLNTAIPIFPNTGIVLNGDSIGVRVVYDFEPATPLGSMLALFINHNPPYSTIRMTDLTVMKLEPTP